VDDTAVDLSWIPLGAGVGGGLVRWSGRTYEFVAARLGHRARGDLYHSALIVSLGGANTAIEMAPVWFTRGERGVVAEGAVGASVLWRWRLFRYEGRWWAGGAIPDVAAAVDGPRRVSSDSDVARRVLELVPQFATFVWGRDELETGDMWNSNSLVSWLLVGAAIDLSDVAPPTGGRAPGWDAGVAAGTAS
jgi:hypothetical protein